jgi:putative aminopeptidase FrvX
VIVRVGDARSIFHPPLTDVLFREARALAAEDASFRFQRRLMDGGSCEATAFCAAGYRAGGLCVPLGNYHNMRGLDGGRVGVGAEQVHVNDFASEVKLLVRLALRSSRLAALERAADDWLDAATARALRTLDAAPELAAAPRRQGAVSR